MHPVVRRHLLHHLAHLPGAQARQQALLGGGIEVLIHTDRFVLAEKTEGNRLQIGGQMTDRFSNVHRLHRFQQPLDSVVVADGQHGLELTRHDVDELQILDGELIHARPRCVAHRCAAGIQVYVEHPWLSSGPLLLRIMAVSLSQVSVRTAGGSDKSLGEYAGKVLLIVNVASRCGFTPQYEGLQALQDRYGDQGLAVLGFPCNDFGAQEPGSLDEIKTFCSTKFGASFELFDKVHAMGSTTEPYTTLNKTEPAGDVAWNFEKFLVGRDGTVIARYKSGVAPDSAELTGAIEAALKAG